MEQQVREFLEQRFAGMEVETYSLSSGRVAGQVVWAGFADADQVERQQVIRQALKARFGPEARDISVLLTYTPDEMRQMLAA